MTHRGLIEMDFQMKKFLFVLVALASILIFPKIFASAPYLFPQELVVDPAQAKPVQDVVPMHHNFKGFYAGGSVGYRSEEYSYSSNAKSNNFELIGPMSFVLLQENLNADKQSGGVVGAIHLGYGIPLGKDFYLGVESSLNVSSDSGKKAISEAMGDTKTFWRSTLSNENISNMRALEVSIDLDPGVLLSSDTLLYGLVGVAFNKLRLTLSSHFARSSAADPIVIDRFLSRTVRKSLIGVRAGIGIKQQISRSIALFLQYAYTYYGKVQISNSANFSAPQGPPGTIDTMVNSSTVRVMKSSIIFGLDWYFME